METTTQKSFLNEREAQENRRFHPLAARSKDHDRGIDPNDYRSPYKRDTDRILHSKAYSRYEDKTQVVYLFDNDHITHRSLHVQLVSGYARGIGQALALNTDLIEAISLGHDVGHPPFGHEGEEYLSALSIEYGNGPFTHPWQSCRLFRLIEPLDLGLAVYDGFLCHDGGLEAPEICPNFGKTAEEHERELVKKKDDPDVRLTPATLEGSLVKLCDTISYLARDIEDAIVLGLLEREDLPAPFTGNRQKELLHFFAQDLITQSLGKEIITLSESAFEKLKMLRAFNFKNIYFHERLKKESKRVERGYRILFSLLLEDYEKKGEASHLYREYLENKSSAYLDQTPPVQKVVDYMAGMTDRYFLRTLKQFLIPQPMLWL